MINLLKSFVLKDYRGQFYLDWIMWFYDSYSYFTWQLSKKAQLSRKRVLKLKNRYKGERCFIVGNGPSLKRTNLKLLKNEYSFGLNRAYLMFDRLGFETTFLASVNKLVIQQCAKDINKVKTKKFIGWKARKFLRTDDNTIFIRTLARQVFSKDISRGVWEGATVTYVAMQIAYHMGFNKVILIGVDHNFKTKGRPHDTVVSRGKDKDHFSSSYFGKGFKWNLPDLSTSEYAYSMAKKAFEKDGREIVDATVGGNLKVFKKVKYSELFFAK